MKRFQFIENITKSKTDFREHVLSTFLKIFGYKKSVFWYTNEDGSILSDPITLNIGSNEMSNYVERYKQTDPILNNPNTFSKHNVFCYSDFLTLNEFKGNEFFHFMQINNNQDIISLCINDGRKQTGVISFLRSFDEDAFTIYDKIRLEFLSNYIANLLWSFQSVNLRNQIQIIEKYSNILSIGVAIIEDSSQIRYYNKKALDICRSLTPSIKHPIQEIISQIVQDKLNKLDSGFSFLHPAFPKLHIKVERLQIREYWIVLFIPESLHSLIEPKSGILEVLTQREHEVAALLIRGFTNKEISNHLIISINTVKRHIGNIYSKLGVNNKTELCYLVNSF
jgi:DNA-binding CsgD family transcriptional regulator